MKLRGRSEDGEDTFVPYDSCKSAEKPAGTCSNTTSEQTASNLELHSHSSVPSLPERLPELPDIGKPEQLPPVTKKKGRRKRKSAEEKAANVRARNRRAQQAFRKRQKALSQEKNESMANLLEEIDELRATNSVLQSTIDSLLRQLENREMIRLERVNTGHDQIAHASMPALVRSPDALYMHNADIPQMLDDASVPDIMAEDSVPDLLHGLEFGQPF